MIENFTAKLDAENFKATKWGYDSYEKDSLFSKHISLRKTPTGKGFLIQLTIGWADGYANNDLPLKAWRFFNNHLSRVGVTWLHPDYPENSNEFIFFVQDIDFLSSQGLHFIKRWFDLHTDIDFLIGLYEYQAKLKSQIPKTVYSFMGFASNRNTKKYDNLTYLYAMKGNFDKALYYLNKYGISDMSGYEWTVRLSSDLQEKKFKTLKPYDLKNDFIRLGGAYFNTDMDSQKTEIFNKLSSQYYPVNSVGE